MKRGTPIDVSKVVNCTKCTLRDKCRDDRKSKKFACSFFVEADMANPSDVKFTQFLRQLAESESVVADKWQIDDGDAPLAPNFYRWCVGKQYLKMDPKPYPKQLQLGLKFFNDMCYFCSPDKEWLDEIPHDADIEEIPERLRLLRHGRCPKCKRTRLDAINRGRTVDYEDLVCVAGQRCVSGDTLVTTTRGLTRIGDFAKGLGYGWHERPFKRRDRVAKAIGVIAETGTYLDPTRLFVAKPEKLLVATTREGIRLRGTHEHPIMTRDGFTKLRDVTEGAVVPVYFGQDVWNRASHVSTDLARLIGFWVSEGSGSKNSIHVTNYDHDILDLCAREMKKLATGVEIKMRDRDGVDPSLGLKRCVGTKHPIAYRRFSKLVDGAWRKSADKVIPRTILEADRDAVCAFLQALFEGDGSVSDTSVGYASLSMTLVRQLQTVLLNLGIPSKLRRRMSWATNGTEKQVSKPYLCLTIKGKAAMEAFQQNVGFFSERKKKALAEAVAYWSNREHDVPVWSDVYPTPIKDEYMALLARVDGELTKFRPMSDKKAGFGQGHTSLRRTVGDYRRLFEDNVGLSRSRLARYAEKLTAHRRWRDLSLDLRVAVMKFHETYLNPKCYWTTVRSVELTRKKYKTYDFHVPHHHKFMANGLLNHNSGKCLVGDTWVRTDSGLKQIRHCTINDRAMLGGRSLTITKFWRRPKKTIYALKTAMGYEVKGTPDHKVLTVEGFRELKGAKTVRVETTFGPFPSRQDWRRNVAAGLVHKAHLGVRSGKTHPIHLLSLLDQEGVVTYIRENVVEELFSEGTLGLRLKTGQWAEAVHQVFLMFGVVATRSGTLLKIVQPWSRRYVRHVGVKDRHIAASVALSIRRCNPYVHEAVSRLLDDACKQIDPVEYQPPAITSAWAEYKQKMFARTFRRGDVRGAYATLKALRVKDDFYKHLTLSLMRSSVSPDAVWDTVVSTKLAKPEEVYDIEVSEMHAFVANGLVVHNSTSIGLIASYPTHQLLKLKNPAGFYGIKQGTILYSTVVGLTYSGAKTNVWDPLLATIQDSPWFETMHEILNDAAAKRGEEELARVKDTYIYYRNAGLYMSPASPSRRTLRGKTRIMSTVDELAHFSSNDKLVNISGIEVWNALSRSMQTVRLGAYKLRKRGVVNIPPAMQVAISSPYETTDPIMTLYNKPTSKTYAVLYPTWEFNPDMTFEFLQPEFDRDSVTAWRDFGSRPPYSAASFVANIDPYRRVVSKSAKPCAEAETYVVSRKGKRVLTAAKLKWNWTDKSIGKVLALDAGATFNAFAIVVAHLSATGKTVYDCLIEIHPTPGRPISFTRIYEDVLVPLVEKMNVKVIISDRWQNRKIHDDAEDKLGVVPIEHKLKYGDLLAWREALMEGQLELPKAELSPQDILYPPQELKTFINRPVASFIYESLRVVDVPGKKVEKPTEGSDDVWRAGVLAHTALHLPDVREVLTAGDVQKRSNGGIGAYATSGSVAGRMVVPGVGVRPGGFSGGAASGVGVLRR